MKRPFANAGILSPRAGCICRCRLLSLLLLLLSFSPWAQVASDAPAVTPALVQQYIDEVSARTDLEDPAKAELLDQLQSATKRLEEESAHLARAAELQLAIDRESQEVARFQQLLRQAENSRDELEIASDADPTEIQSQIALVQAERRSLSERRSELLQQVSGFQARRTAVRERIAKVKELIESNRNDLQVDAKNLEQRVALTADAAANQALVAESRNLETELLSESARANVSAAERNWLNHALAETDLQLQALGRELDVAVEMATRQELQTATSLEARLQGEDPAIEDFAETNRKLAEQLQQTASEADKARQDDLEMRARLEYIEQDSLLMQRRLEVAGRKELLGRVLINRLNSLPDVRAIKRDIKVRNEVIASNSIAHINVEEELRELSDRQGYLDSIVPDWSQWDDKSRALVNELVDQRQQLLEDNLRSTGGLLRSLVDNNVNASALISATDSFHRLLMGNLLWIRNFSFVDIKLFSEQLAVLFSPRDWASLPLALVSGFKNAGWSMALLVVYGIVLLLRKTLKKPLRELLSRPTPLSAESLWNILLGLGMSLLLVLPWPLSLFLAGYFLESAEPQSRFLAALAPALMVTSIFLYALLLTRLLVGKRGVGRRMLKWDSRMLDALRRELNWAGPVVVLASLFDIFALGLDVVASGGPLGVLATAVTAITLSTVAIRLLRQEIFATDKLLRRWLFVVALLGAVVIILQLLGLLFAADAYLGAVNLTIVVVFGTKLVGDILERWLLILRARLVRKNRAQIAQQSAGGEAEAEKDQAVDVITLSEAHRKLLFLIRLVTLASVLWVIWSPALPALNLLDSVTLWHVTDSAHPGGDLRAITLFDVTLSVFILITTVLVAKHLPSLVQVFMLEWFNVSAGSRYASSILMQYVVIAVGASLFLGAVGWEWGKVQWLVAALGVGIGFGLQEIVANFISGIIILFERPIRVGDIISAGGAEGTVKQINPRATIIETFDMKEHLIPNKELITGQVVNWSLSSNAIRVIIPVGIAYGSDVRRALALLLEAAQEVPLVQAEPPARATFEDFGDNALILWLRCYVAEDRIGAWTDLRARINDKFNEAGIVISFPQRDVHLDMVEPLRIEIRKDDHGD